MAKKKASKKKASKKKVRSKGWVPPEDMPKNQVRSVRTGRQCGADITSKKGAGGYCKRTPTTGQKGGYPHRCKYHGGESTGAGTGNQNSRTHGMYSDVFVGAELEDYKSALEEGLDLSNEIAAMKVRLIRALKEERRQRELIDAGKRSKTMEPDETVHEQGMSSTGPVDKLTIKKRMPDVKRAIHMIVQELGKLIGHQTILKGGGALSPEEQAREARQALFAMRDSINLEEGED